MQASGQAYCGAGRVAQKYGDGIMSPERAPYLNWGERRRKEVRAALLPPLFGDLE